MLVTRHLTLAFDLTFKWEQKYHGSQWLPSTFYMKETQGIWNNIRCSLASNLHLCGKCNWFTVLYLHLNMLA